MRSAVASAIMVALSACGPAQDHVPEAVSEMEERLLALERNAQQVTGSQTAYTFVMAEDPVSVAMAGQGELPVLVYLSEVTTNGDSQSIRLVARNPYSLRLTGLKFNVAWDAGGVRSEDREVEWTGAVDPGFPAEVVFRVGPVAAEDLTSVTISDVRSRWAGRRPS